MSLVGGMDRLREELRAMANRLADKSKAAPELHAEALRQYNAMDIPTRTGGTASSLRNPGDPDHIFEVSPDGATVGSKERGAFYQRHRIKDLDGAKFVPIWQRYLDGD